MFFDLVATSTRTKTPEGFLRGFASLTRSGIIQYRASELSLDGDPDRIVRVYRKPEHVFNEHTVDSIRGAIVTLEHPPSGVTPDSWRKNSVGSVVGEPYRDGDLLVSEILIGDSRAIEKIEKSGWDELSVGYRHDMVAAGEGKGYDYETSSPLLINHVAIVERGRAGSRVRIFDTLPPDEEAPMTGMTQQQVVDTIRQSLAERDSEIQRQNSQKEDMQQFIRETVADALNQALADMGMHKKKDMSKKKDMPGEMEEDENDNQGSTGRQKMMKRNQRRPMDQDADRFSEKIDQIADGLGLEGEARDAASQLVKQVMSSEMQRVQLMRDVGPMLSEEQHQKLAQASSREIMLAALGDTVQNPESKSDDYLRAMVDMAKTSHPVSESATVIPFDRYPSTVPANPQGSSDSYRVVGQDDVGDISNFYDDYTKFLANSFKSDTAQGGQ